MLVFLQPLQYSNIGNVIIVGFLQPFAIPTYRSRNSCWFFLQPLQYPHIGLIINASFLQPLQYSNIGNVIVVGFLELLQYPHIGLGIVVGFFTSIVILTCRSINSY
jgi:hypothetical protein